MLCPMKELTPGASGTATMIVGTRDTAPRVGSGGIAVLATPIMINLIEEAAVAAAEHLLPEGQQSLGTSLDVTHVAPTPVGMEVTAVAEVSAVDGRSITFKVVARDAQDVIGEGLHERVVVTEARFTARVAEKAAR